MNGHNLAARFVAETRWENLPAAVQRKARMCFADSLGAALAGTLTHVSRISADYAVEAWGGDQATVLRHEPGQGLYGLRASMAGAAFANANAANGLDLDDSARYAYGHAGAQIIPAALAVAEALDRTGAELLAALVVGYEVAHRIGRCWHASRDVYQACGSWGSVACAAAAANLMRLTPEQCRPCVGHRRVSRRQSADDARRGRSGHGEARHRLGRHDRRHRGRAGRAGLHRHPYPPGAPGSTRRSGRSAHRYRLTRKPYLMVDGVAWKPARYACCGWAHAGVEGARRLVQEHDIPLEEIVKIIVAGSKSTVRLGTRLPTTTEEAQFNQAWPLAAMLVDGEIGPAQMLEARLSDPQIRMLAAKVEVVEDRRDGTAVPAL